MLSERLAGLSLQPGAQSAQTRERSYGAWVGTLWLCIVREKKWVP